MEEVRSQSRGGLVDDQCLQLESSYCLLPGLLDDVTLNCLARALRSDYDSLSCVNKRFHKLITSGYLHELRKQLRIVEHWVYLTCGWNRWVAFDPVTNKWMSVPKIPSETDFDFVYERTHTMDSDLLVLGGYVHDRFVIWKYSWICRGWVKCEGMNQPRCSYGYGSFGSTFVVAGGVDENKTVLNSAELYDAATGKWEALPNMHYACRACSGCFMDGKFYVIGGISSLDGMLTCGEEYDFETKKWRTIEGMTPYLRPPPPIVVVDNQLYTVERFSNMLRKYDKANNAWDVLGGLPLELVMDFKACRGELVFIRNQKDPGGVYVVLHS